MSATTVDTLAEALRALHLLRPHWLWALLAIPLLLAAWRARQRRASVWRGAVDAHLLPHLLDSAPTARSRATAAAGVLAYALAVIALAGPSWRQVEQPLWQAGAPLVVALDLSSASAAADVPPSRLAQSRAKLSALLRDRQGGQVGLVAFAGDAFTVAPLTDDAANVALFLDALAPDVMPVDGQRVDRAIAWSSTLLQRAGFRRGQILLLTDHADTAALSAAAAAAELGYTVSVLGVGSEAGAAYRRLDGGIDRARLDTASLRTLAARGDGRYAALQPGDADLRALGVLGVLDRPGTDATSRATRGEQGGAWADDGYWLLPPLLLLGLLAFRRGGAVAVLAVCLWLPMPRAHAADLWRRPDQAAHARMVEAAKAYRRGEFQRAADLYAGIDSADAHYDRGNALAKAGQYPQALQAYDRALRLQPGMDDAQANRRAVEQAMKRKPPRGQKSGQQPGQPSRPPSAPPSARSPAQPGQDGQPSPGQPQPPPQSPSAPSEPGRTPPPPSAGQPEKPAGDAKPADAQAQQAADAAQKARMQRALQQAQAGKPAKPASAQAEGRETPAQRERRLANEAWLKRVPDEPGGLLRAKFRLEYERRLQEGAQE